MPICTYLNYVPTFSKLLSILNVPASAKQDIFLLYSVSLMMKKMKNLINFILPLQQSKQKIYQIIALFTQLCELWNECVFIATIRLCFNRFIYTPTRHYYDVTFISDVIRPHVTFQTFFSDVNRHHHSFLCWEQYNIYLDAWKQKTLCVQNDAIFTQYQNSRRSLILYYSCKFVSFYSHFECLFESLFS